MYLKSAGNVFFHLILIVTLCGMIDLITVGALRFPGVLRGTEIVPGVTVSRPGGLLRPEVRNLATLWD